MYKFKNKSWPSNYSYAAPLFEKHWFRESVAHTFLPVPYQIINRFMYIIIIIHSYHQYLSFLHMQIVLNLFIGLVVICFTVII